MADFIISICDTRFHDFADNGRGLYPAFFPWFDAAQPLADDQDQDAADRAEGYVEIANGVKDEAKPPASSLPEGKPGGSQKKVEKESQPIPAAYCMIQRPEQECRRETEQD